MQQAIRILELHKVKDAIKQHCVSELGIGLLDELYPSAREKEIRYRLGESAEALKIINALGSLPLEGVTDVTDLIKRAEVGAVLSELELLALSKMLGAVSNIEQFLEQLDEIEVDAPVLKKNMSQMHVLGSVRKQIISCIDASGVVLDEASPELRDVRRSIHHANITIKEKMNDIVNSRRDKLTEALVTIRNNRFVVPVKIEFKNTFKGTIHDQSSSGNTFYIEPKEIVDLNNRLNELAVRERYEIERILRMLSAVIGEHVEELSSNVRVLGVLDLMFAKGKYAKATRSTMPSINTMGVLKLIDARHPLIDASVVVANDIVVESRAMVITGPNTGGKTVTLKTVGLLTLMMQSGFLVPVHESSEMSIFEHVFADIGDEQSIEQSLSTFSSHMKNIVGIIGNLSANSLVLFDELGSGTDPREGASLGVAILDYVKTRARLTIATSHYPELKAYAYESDDVMNASVEFDVDTLSPTYRLLMGVPGRSNAFEISRRLGLNEKILDAASEDVASNRTEVSELITKLEDRGAELDVKLREVHAQNETALKLRTEYEEKVAKFEGLRERELEKAKVQADVTIKEARETAEKIVSELRAIKKQTNVKDHELTEKLSALDKVANQHQQKFKKTAKNPTPLKPGDEVMVLSLARQGELIEKIKNGDWSVAMGSMKVNIKESDLQFIKSPAKKKQTKHKGHMSVQVNHASTKLDLRGQRYDDAMVMLDRYFDEILMSGYDTFTIIHGHGTGAIRNGVQKYLKSNKHVSEYRFGGQGEGGMGATVVKLK